MRKTVSIILVAFLLMLSFVTTAYADGPDPVLVNGTTPVSTDVRDAINAWLATDAPADAPYFAVTYAQAAGDETIVSLVALNISDPNDEWFFVDEGNAPSAVVWIGSVRVFSDGEVQPFQSGGQANGGGHMASPVSAGGGSYVAFPWEAGKSVIYGSRAVHGSGDYGTSGMVAVDLVSGTDLGSGAANDKAYASDAGEIDYICDDGIQIAVRTYNSTTGDYFIYAHLLDNAGLTMGAAFTRGQSIGTLKHGTFSDTCGWAQQQDNHWHVHWMFTPANNAFRAEDCTLQLADKKWHCGATEVVGTGGWLTGGGGYGATSGGTKGTHDPGTDHVRASLENSLWDNIIVGVAFIIDPFWKVTPEHQGLTFLEPLYHTMELVFRLVRVFAYGNINLGPVLALLLVALAFKAAMWLIWLVVFALKAWKSLVPVMGA